VVQNETGNRFSRTTIVAAITSQPRSRPYPFHVSFTAQESGLEMDGLVLCEQLQTIDQSRLIRRSGALKPEKMEDVDLALHRSLGLKA
jgi:mRNA interferase MazF